MASTDIVYEQVHFRHDPKWSVRLRSAEGGELVLCVACAIEMMETEEMAVSITPKLTFSDIMILYSTFKMLIAFPLAR